MSWVVWAYEVSDPGPEPKQWKPAWLVTKEGIDPDQPPEGYFDIFYCKTEEEARQLQSELNTAPPEDTRKAWSWPDYRLGGAWVGRRPSILAVTEVAEIVRMQKD